MLDLIFDCDCPDISKLSQSFWFKQTWQMNLARSMGLSQGVASLTANSLGLGPGTWFLLSPILWQATHNDAMIVQVAADKSGLYFAALQKFLAQDGGRIFAISEDLWLMDACFLAELESCDLNQVMHHSLQPLLQKMSPSWRRWWTEVQMLFQTLTGNAPALINGVWPWGGGAWTPNQVIYCHSQCEEFKALNGQDWNPKTWPKTGVVVIDQVESMAIYQSLSATQGLRLWWRNGYSEQLPLSIWQRIRKWVQHAN
jgi:hypothetical protein